MRIEFDRGRSNAGHPEDVSDRVREKALGTSSKAEAGEAKDIGLCAPEEGVHHRFEPLEKGARRRRMRQAW